MSLLKFLSFIPEFFVKLFNSAKRAFKKSQPEVQEALKKGSGIVAIINDNVSGSPAFVWELILKKWPDVTKEKALELIKKGTEGFAVASEIMDSDDLEIVIGKVQKFLDGLEGKTWAKISRAFALGVAAFLAPVETKLEALASLLGYVYHDLIKGK